MRSFTVERNIHTPDALWFLEHTPVFTQGQAGKKEHLLNTGDIPVIQSDRGGQVTYHGEGQLMIYTLFDLKRLKFGIKDLVDSLQQSVIKLLKSYGIEGRTECKAPGVYVNETKIASIGLRVRQGFTYHGMSLNVCMDLEPFTRINPCGFEQLTMVQIQDFQQDITIEQVKKAFIPIFIQSVVEKSHVAKTTREREVCTDPHQNCSDNTANEKNERSKHGCAVKPAIELLGNLLTEGCI